MKPRYSQRVSVKCPAVLSIGPVLGQGQVLDLTTPGCMLETTLAVKVGDRIQLKCFLPGHQPLCVSEGFVRWIKGSRCGVEFVKMSEKDRRLLNQFVSIQSSRQSQEGSRKFSESGANWHLQLHALPKKV